MKVVSVREAMYGAVTVMEMEPHEIMGLTHPDWERQSRRALAGVVKETRKSAHTIYEAAARMAEDGDQRMLVPDWLPDIVVGSNTQFDSPVGLYLNGPERDVEEDAQDEGPMCDQSDDDQDIRGQILGWRDAALRGEAPDGDDLAELLDRLAPRSALFVGIRIREGQTVTDEPASDQTDERPYVWGDGEEPRGVDRLIETAPIDPTGRLALALFAAGAIDSSETVHAVVTRRIRGTRVR